MCVCNLLKFEDFFLELLGKFLIAPELAIVESVHVGYATYLTLVLAVDSRAVALLRCDTELLVLL